MLIGKTSKKGGTQEIMRRWEDNIKANLKEMGMVGLALVNMATDMWVPKGGKCLDYLS
jgi:hypothetical protein